MALTGCAAAPHRADLYVPGVYKGVGEGMHGDILVETEFSASRIISVKIVEHEDTPVISDAAIEKIPEAVLKAQNADVDVVTGATVTSEGIKVGVRNTISQALYK